MKNIEEINKKIMQMKEKKENYIKKIDINIKKLEHERVKKLPKIYDLSEYNGKLISNLKAIDKEGNVILYTKDNYFYDKYRYIPKDNRCFIAAIVKDGKIKFGNNQYLFYFDEKEQKYCLFEKYVSSQKYIFLNIDCFCDLETCTEEELQLRIWQNENFTIA